MEFFELFLKFKELWNLIVISRFLGHPRLFLDEKLMRVIFEFFVRCPIH